MNPKKIGKYGGENNLKIELFEKLSISDDDIKNFISVFKLYRFNLNLEITNPWYVSLETVMKIPNLIYSPDLYKLSESLFKYMKENQSKEYDIQIIIDDKFCFFHYFILTNEEKIEYNSITNTPVFSNIITSYELTEKLIMKIKQYKKDNFLHSKDSFISIFSTSIRIHNLQDGIPLLNMTRLSKINILRGKNGLEEFTEIYHNSIIEWAGGFIKMPLCFSDI
jgi:hypothetical protein